jgi:hypothetical protein
MQANPKNIFLRQLQNLRSRFSLESENSCWWLANQPSGKSRKTKIKNSLKKICIRLSAAGVMDMSGETNLIFHSIKSQYENMVNLPGGGFARHNWL